MTAEPELPYRYYVAYAHGTGFGGIDIRQALPMRSFNDVRGVAKLIAERIDVATSDVVVLSWQRYEAEAASLTVSTLLHALLAEREKHKPETATAVAIIDEDGSTRDIEPDSFEEIVSRETICCECVPEPWPCKASRALDAVLATEASS